MTEDETGGGGGRSSEGPDPSFIKDLEDDSLWAYGHDSRGERRVDRYRSRPSRVQLSEQRLLERRNTRRLRRVAVLVLIVAAVAIALTGLSVKDSEYGSSSLGRSAPFSILPLQRATTTTESTTTSSTTSSTTTASTTTSTTSTTTPVAEIVSR